MSSKIGFIGLGRMGKGMASNLQRKGFALMVMDINPAPVAELVALAKARPDQLTYGTSGAGGINHLAGELLQSMTGAKWLHIPFKGAGPAIIAALGGETEFAIASTIGLVAHVKSGKLRGVAVTGTQRFAELPNVMTVAEAGVPGFEATQWYGLLSAAGTPRDVIDMARVRTAIRAQGKIRLVYRDEKGEETVRVVWPIAVSYWERVRLIVAWCELRRGFRHFRTDRIERLEVVDERYPRRRQALLREWRSATALRPLPAIRRESSGSTSNWRT